MKGRVAEIFESVQGEGLYIGEKQVFVRFYGCNLSCVYCDTKLTSFSEYEPEELFNIIKHYRGIYHSIAFTGGEPLLQKNFLKEILALTRADGYRNYLETNGTLPGELREVIENVDIIAMDIKLASSARMGNLLGLHSKFLEIASLKEVFLKAVICQSTTLEDLKQALGVIRKINNSVMLVLQPNSLEEPGLLTDKLENFRDTCALEGVTCCIIPQMHKIVGIK